MLTNQNLFQRNGLLTLGEAAKVSGLSKNTLYSLEKQGLPFIRFSTRKVFIRETDLIHFIEQKINTS